MVFLSWSKLKSKKIAEYTRDFFLECIDGSNPFWISDELQAGKNTFDEIIKCIFRCKSCIIFLTNDNIHNPWINFELGAFQTLPDVEIYPLYFDKGDPYRISSATPFSGIQIWTYSYDTIRRTFFEICNRENLNITISDEIFRQKWQQYDSLIKTFLWENSIESEWSLENIRFDFTNNWGIKCFEGQILNFDRGFETYELYRYCITHAERRFWVYGRKNRKLFDNTFRNDFISLGQRIANGKLSFKCLFFSQHASPQLLDFAQKKKNFSSALNVSVDQCLDILYETNISADCIRFYENIRNEAIIIIDNLILFAPVKYDNDRKPFHLTDAPFFACMVESGIGQHLIETFENVWQNAKSVG